MTDRQITALAREYAEEIRKDILPFFPRPLPESMEVLIKADQEKVERVIRFLLRRFSLVEKEAVRKEYDSVKDTPDDCDYEEHGATWDEWPYLSRFYDEGYKLGRKDAIESLFPDLRKEEES